MRSLAPLFRLRRPDPRRPARGIRCGSRLLAPSILALAFGCTPPPSFPETTPDPEDDAQASPPLPPPIQMSGRELPLHSSGAAEGEAWVLHASGFSGVFLRLEKRGHVTIRVTAAGAGPFSVVLGEQGQSFSATSEPKPYEFALDLPSGTHFLRIDAAAAAVPPATPTAGAAPAPRLSVSSVSVSGAQWIKDASDRTALDAANTFIQNYRKGSVELRLHGVDPGGAVQIKLLRHAFDFGVNLPLSEERLLTAQPAPDSEAARYQELVLQHFNTVALSTGGTSSPAEPERDPLDVAPIDRLLAFARDNALEARLHAVIGGPELEPSRQQLLGQIRERLAPLAHRRAGSYLALDVLDQSVQPGRYWQAYGVDGIAQIFNETARAVQAAGRETKLYLNEFDVLQGPKLPEQSGGGEGVADPFANGYRWHAEELRRAGAPLGGLGVQSYADGRAPIALAENAHSPARLFGVLQNLSGTGLELSLAELGVNAEDGVPPERGADIVEDTLRLVFGTPAAAAVLIGAAWGGAASPPALPSLLFDEHFVPTPAGVRYQALMKEWDTQLNAPLGADGRIEFAGFYGAYLIQSGGKSGCLSVRKGQTDYELELQPAPRGPNAAVRRCRSL